MPAALMKKLHPKTDRVQSVAPKPPLQAESLSCSNVTMSMHLATAGIAPQPCSAQWVLHHRGPLHRLHPALQGHRCQRSRSQQDAPLHRSVQCWGVCHRQGGSGCDPAGPAPGPGAPPGCCKLVSCPLTLFPFPELVLMHFTMAT